MCSFVEDLARKDLQFILTIYNKLNVTPPSWYWRELNESEDE
jgi:hypothetical protein